jgi:probable F420-dependent oxidoreductase
MLDPFVALTAVAMATERLKIGTGILLLIQRDPLIVAKEVATLDLLSGGRFLFGIGAGWHRGEMRNHGTDPRSRFRLLREQVLVLKSLWTDDETEFDGDFLGYRPLWLWPKPVQQPHPPVMLGGEGPTVLERVVDYADEWFPNAHDGIEERVRELQRLAYAAARAPIPVTVIHTEPDIDTIRGYAEAGVTRCLFSLPSSGREEVEPLLEQFSAVIRAFGRGG